MDDEELFRRAFQMILESEDDIEVVGEAADGLEAIEATKRLKPDVVLMDMRMPRLDGVQAVRRLATFKERPGALLVTAFDGDQCARAALDAGASGFLPKHSRSDELLAAVRRAAASAVDTSGLARPRGDEFP